MRLRRAPSRRLATRYTGVRSQPCSISQRAAPPIVWTSAISTTTASTILPSWLHLRQSHPDQPSGVSAMCRPDAPHAGQLSPRRTRRSSGNSRSSGCLTQGLCRAHALRSAREGGEAHRPAHRYWSRHHLHEPKVALLAAPDRTWAADEQAPRGTLETERLPGGRRTRLLPPGERDAARPSEDCPCFPPASLRGAGITKPFRPFHDLRHTSLTHEAAAGNPMAYVQLKAGHSQAATTERYVHAAQVIFPGAAARGEGRIFDRVER
jgi:hypothetical protein